jgi:hypothetical protein
MAEIRRTTTKAAADKKTYLCEIRGMSVPAEQPCGGSLFCDIDCGGTSMSARKKRTGDGVPLVRLVGDA